jgi:cephalosporin hydroxylase
MIMARPLLQLLQPEGVRIALARYKAYRKEMRARQYWTSLSEKSIKAAVDNAIQAISDLTDNNVVDSVFLENELIPKLGLNNEMLHEQPTHLREHFGKGLHIWQYPKQFGPFLAWIARHGAEVQKYLEIGVRWGGAFIVVSEFMRRVSPGFKTSIAVDPIEPSPLMQRYVELGRAEYRQYFSTEAQFRSLIDSERPDFVFIDGDHTLKGVMHDFDVCRSGAHLIAFHDVMSDGCVDTTFFWSFLKRHATGFDHFEFTDQYDSVAGNFMGIGALLRKDRSQARATE